MEDGRAMTHAACVWVQYDTARYFMSASLWVDESGKGISFARNGRLRLEKSNSQWIWRVRGKEQQTATTAVQGRGQMEDGFLNAGMRR